jgi:hypothetical protein
MAKNAEIESVPPGGTREDALEAALNGCDYAGGMATIRVKDGFIFVLTAEKLRVLLGAAESNPDKKCLVFVKMSSELKRQ